MFTLPDRTVYKADSIVAIIKKVRSDLLVEIRAEFLSFWTADCKRQKDCSKCSYLCFSLERHHGRCSVSENRHAAYFRLACEAVLFVCLCDTQRFPLQLCRDDDETKKCKKNRFHDSWPSFTFFLRHVMEKTTLSFQIY